WSLWKLPPLTAVEHGAGGLLTETVTLALIGPVVNRSAEKFFGHKIRIIPLGKIHLVDPFAMLLEKEGNLLHEAEPRCGSKPSAMIRSGFGPRLTAGDEPLDEPRLAAPAHSPPSST